MSTAPSYTPDDRPPHDVDAMLAALAVIMSDSEARELRGIGFDGSPGAVSALVQPNDPDGQRAAIDRVSHADSIYFGLNPVPESLADRAAKDGDVLRRTRILVDVDPVRAVPGKVSATDAEKAEARLTAESIDSFLASKGWPHPIDADSGNGYALIFGCDLPNTPESRGLVDRLLRGLAQKFDTPGAEVDQSVKNASRVAKLPGSMSRKGPDTPERPHRRSCILGAPAVLAATPEDVIRATVESLEVEFPPVESPGPTPIPFPSGDADVGDVVKRARAYVLSPKFPCAIEGAGGHKALFNAACRLVDGFGLSFGEALPILSEFNETKAVPPESAFQVEHKLRGAITIYPNPSRKLLLAPRPGGRPKSREKKAKPSVGAGEHPDDHDQADADEAPYERPVDDPVHLADKFVDEEYGGSYEPTLLNHRGDFYRWDEGAWQLALSSREIELELFRTVDEAFVEANTEALAEWQEGGGEDAEPKPLKATRSAVADAMLALESRTILDSRIDAPSWLGGDGPFPASEVVAARNALVWLPGYVAGDPSAVMEPTPRFFSTRALPYDFDFGAPPPMQWLGFLGSIFPYDQESIDHLQERLGYALVDDTSQQQIFWNIGVKRSGKGTVSRVLHAMLGSSAVVALTIQDLAAQFGLSNTIGKSVIAIGDARISPRTDTSVIVERLLEISGEDAISIDRKYKPLWTGKLPARIFINSNELPRVFDSSEALIARSSVLHYTQDFTGREDRDLTKRLLTELPSILLWSIQGYARLRERGRFLQPTSGADLLDAMRDLVAPVSTFFQDRCVRDPSRNVPSKQLYDAWCGWCEESGREKPGSPSTFGHQFSAHTGIYAKPIWDGALGKSVRAYPGVDLKVVF